jgi:hypothetical protein
MVDWYSEDAACTSEDQYPSGWMRLALEQESMDAL